MEGNTTWGVDGDTGSIVDMKDFGIWEPLSVKIQIYKTAIEVRGMVCCCCYWGGGGAWDVAAAAAIGGGGDGMLLLLLLGGGGGAWDVAATVVYLLQRWGGGCHLLPLPLHD